MKRTVNLLYLVISISAFAIFSILTLSFGIHYEWLSFNSFWIVWLMTTIPVLISTIVTCCFLNKYQNFEQFASLPLVICSMVFEAVSYILGVVLIVLISSMKGEVAWYMWTIELIIIVVYAVILFYFIYGTNYIFKNRNNTKNKVNNIKKLVKKLDEVILAIQDEDFKKAVENLRDNIRYSDPMSGNSTIEVEEALYSTVLDITEKIHSGEDFETCKVQLQKAQFLLAQRNEEVKYSK